MAPLLEPAQTFYITYCVIYCIYSGTWQCKASVLFLSTPGPKCCSSVVCAWASGMFSAMISNTKHLLKAHATDAFLAPLTEVGGAMWDQQTTAENLFCGSTRRGWQQETATPGTAAPPQRCHSKQGQSQPPRHLPGQHNCSSQDSLPLQHGAVASAGTSHPQHAQLWISNKTLCYMVEKYTKLTARSKSHN